MKALRILSLAAIALLSAGFASAQGTAANVGFTEVRNYFHRNDAPMPSSPLITTQKEFDSQFGAAAFMGKDGQPTRLNFRKQAVVAIVLPVSDKATTISNVSLTSPAKNRLLLSYEVHEGLSRSYSTQPIRLMAVDKKWGKAQVEVKATRIDDIATSETAWKHKNFADKATRLRLYVDYPASTTGSLAASIDKYLAKELAAINAIFTDAGQAIGKANNGNCALTLSNYTEGLTNNVANYNQANQLQDRPSSVDFSFIRTDETPRYATLRTVAYVYSGGAHGLSIDRGATFNMKTGQQARLVKPSEALRKLITARLPKDATEYTEATPAPMPETPAFLTGGKVVFIYQDSEIAPHALGELRCDFYPDELSDYLTEEGKELTSYE